MAGKKKLLKYSLFLKLILLSVVIPLKADMTEETVMKRLDSLEKETARLDEKVLSTLMFGGSSPVSFSGTARMKAQYHNFSVFPEWMREDRSYLQSGWEGNEGLIRIGMVARAGRNTILWSKISFQHTLPGNRWDWYENADGSGDAQSRHDKMAVTAAIHEDMSAGIAVRTKPASFWLKMGNIQWTEASPFTIWKAQPRAFAWDFLPFEVEQPISRYYEYSIAKGVKEGRAAWHKKPFNGINLESIDLPHNFYLNVLYGTFERYDNFEREYIDFSNDLGYASHSFPLKSSGIGDTYRHLFHTRVAGIKLLKDLTVALNFNRINYSDDIVHAGQDDAGDLFRRAFNIERIVQDGEVFYSGKGFYKEPWAASFELKGDLRENLEIHTDIGLSRIDTSYMIYDSSAIYTKKERSGPVVPALYSKVGWSGRLPIEAAAVFIGDGFYSPFSFAAPADAFYAFGSNLTGSGKFIARGESSPYIQNMAGIELAVEPRLEGYGHFRMKYGQHFQPEPGKNVIYVPYRLNGQDFSTFFHSSYNRWGNDPVDWSITDGQSSGGFDARLGDESFIYDRWNNPPGMGAGALWTDFMSTYETFVPYSDSASAAANLESGVQKGIQIDGGGEPAYVPFQRKYTFNLELDASYDIGPLISYPRDLFVGGYVSVSGISTSFKPLAFSENAGDMLLWSFYGRFEPAIALTEGFYLLGLTGFEIWRSDQAWMRDEAAGETAVKHVPVDYRDFAAGLGFDWGIHERVGLHFRSKWMYHEDSNHKHNSWRTPLVSLEIKTWF